MKKSLLMLSLAAAAALAAPVANAAAVSSYGNVALPIYMGSGNVNGNYTVVTDASLGLQAGLRVKDRSTLLTVDGSSGVYSVQQGLCGGACGGTKQYLSYEFSFDSGFGGTPGGDLSNYIVELSVDTNPSIATTFTLLNIFANWGDNEYSADNGLTKHSALAPSSGDSAVQQSANASFSNAGFAGMVLADGLYTIRLDAYLKNENGGKGLLALSDTIVAKVGETVPGQVPEPASFALAGIALFGLSMTRRNKKAPTTSPA